MSARGLELPAPPWSEGVAARCGDVEIGIEEYASFLRRRLSPEDVRETCWHLLLMHGLERRLPDLGAEAHEAGVEAEIARRRAAHDVEYPGIGFEQRLGAAGRTLELLRTDPSVQIATLSRIWVDRKYGEDGLRAVFEEERAFFEGRFGRAVRTHMIFLVAGRFVNDLNSRTFEQAEAELEDLRSRVGNLDDFAALAAELSEEPTTRKARGEIGWLRSADARAPAALRRGDLRVPRHRRHDPDRGLRRRPGAHRRGLCPAVAVGSASQPRLGADVRPRARRAAPGAWSRTRCRSTRSRCSMLIGEVVGSVVSTQKDEQLTALKLLVVQVRSAGQRGDRPLRRRRRLGRRRTRRPGPVRDRLERAADGADARQALRRGDPWRSSTPGTWAARTSTRSGVDVYLARVIGRVVATQRYPGLDGVPLQWIQPLDERGEPTGEALVACAVVSTGPGDLVHFVDGREGALACPEPFVPVDAAILGFVEQAVSLGGHDRRRTRDRRASDGLMFLADVLGTVVSPVQHPVLDGHRLLLVRPVDPARRRVRPHAHRHRPWPRPASATGVLVIDEGNSGRQALDAPDAPVKTVVVGVVDYVDLGGELTFDARHRAPIEPLH